VNSWSMVALSDVLIDAKPGFACGEDLDEGLFQFRMNNITTVGQLDLTKRRRVPRDIPNIEKYSVETGDVLFNATNSADLVGKAAYFPGLEEPAVFSNHFLRLRPASESLDGRYLSRWLNLQFECGRFKSICRKWVNQATVNRDALLAMRLPLPPLSEQRRIAEILDKADALRAKRRAALAQLDTLSRSMFLDMFGEAQAPPATYDRLGNHLVFVTSGGRGWAKFYSSTGSRFIRSLDVQMNHLSEGNAVFVRPPNNAEARRTRAKSGDILLTITGSRIGRVAPLPNHLNGSYVSQHVAILRVDQDRIEPKFLSFFLSLESGGQKQIAKAQYGQTKPGLNFEQVRRFEVPFPAIGRQREFVRRLMMLEKVKHTQHVSSMNLDALFASLQHRAFHGEL
jgi:type I restriction enzyme S subunit